MKISELSAESGVSVATIKFYVREDLLPKGDLTSPNQAQYGEPHLRRLDLIRALQKKARMSLADVGEIVRTIDEAAEGRADYIAVAANRLPLGCTTGDEIAADSPEFLNAQERLRSALVRHGWRPSESCRAWGDTVRALSVINTEWVSVSDERLDVYMESMETIARLETGAAVEASDDPESWVLYVSLGTLLMEPLILGLRRLAHFGAGQA